MRAAGIENGEEELVQAGVDSFAYISLMGKELARRIGVTLEPPNIRLQSIVGQNFSLLGMATLEVRIGAEGWKEIQLGVVERMGICDLLLGLNAHPVLGTKLELGGKTLIGAITAPEVEMIENNDFTVRREVMEETGSQRYRWVFSWKWLDQPPGRDQETGATLYNKPWFDESTGVAFDEEVQRWIQQGILTEGEDGWVLPWNLVEQTHKISTPVRLTIDFTVLNKYLRCETEDGLNEICHREIRRWRSSDGGELIDISKAYLQIHLDETLQRFQCVQYRNRKYRCTRLMFGLSIGPKLLCAVLKRLLDDEIKLGNIGVYRDDILVFRRNERQDKETKERVIKILKENGFHTKPSEQLGKGVSLLGLQLDEKEGRLLWKRKEDIEMLLAEANNGLKTVRQVASWIARLTAKYPVLRWLRLNGNIIKSMIGKQACKDSWNANISEDLRVKLTETVARLRSQGDPAHGIWKIDYSKPWTMWTDASLQAEAAIIENGNEIIEDFVSVIREGLHCNVHELNAILHGVKLWYSYVSEFADSCREVTIKTDSRCVIGWLDFVVKDRVLPKSKSMFYTTVQNRLKAIKNILKDADAKVAVVYVRSEDNLADKLTRYENSAVVGLVSLDASSLFGETCRVLSQPPVVHEWEMHEAANAFHREMGHSGVESCLSTARNHFELENAAAFKRELQVVELNCSVCQVKKARTRTFRSTGPVTDARKFNEEIFLDFLKVASGQEELRGVVVMVDGYSRYAKIHFVGGSGGVNSNRVLEALALWRSEFGNPKVVRLDRGLENNNHPFLEAWHIHI